MRIRLYTKDSNNGYKTLSIIEAESINYRNDLKKIEIIVGNEMYISVNTVSLEDYNNAITHLNLSNNIIELAFGNNTVLNSEYIRNIVI